MKTIRTAAACLLALASITAAAEPLAEFEQIVARCRAAVAEPFVQVVQAPVAKPVCANCGVIDAIIETEKPGEGSGVGASAAARARHET